MLFSIYDIEERQEFREKMQKQETGNEKQLYIGQRLMELRGRFDMTQEELAEQLGVSRQAISRWETNQTFPNIDKLFCISELYKVSLDYLLKGEETHPEGEVAENDLEELTECKADTGTMPIPAGNRSLFLWLAILLICSLLVINSIVLTGLLFHQNWGGKNDTVNYYVDTVYEQYTKAKVVVPREDGSYMEQILWLDAEGIRENDWGFCYYKDAVKGIRLNYNAKTILFPVMTIGILLVLLILLCLEMRKRNEAGNK